MNESCTYTGYYKGTFKEEKMHGYGELFDVAYKSLMKIRNFQYIKVIGRMDIEKITANK